MLVFGCFLLHHTLWANTGLSAWLKRQRQGSERHSSRERLDGLHSPNANIATMLFALRILKPSGWFIVEDIDYPSVPIWQVVATLIPNYSPKLIEAKGGLLFMIQNQASSTL
jgi:hypothetical protein